MRREMTEGKKGRDLWVSEGFFLCFGKILNKGLSLRFILRKDINEKKNVF